MKNNRYISFIINALKSIPAVTLALGITGLGAVSCANDEMEHENKLFSNSDIHFNVTTGGNIAEKESKSYDPVMLISDNGDSLYMTISASANIDKGVFDEVIETKGTPITTANLKTEYQKFKVTAYEAETASSPYIDGKNAVYDSESERWDTDPLYCWPNDYGLDFYAYAPVDITGMTNLTYSSNNTIGFTYQLPAGGQKDASGKFIDAKNQKDILFAVTKNVTRYTDNAKVGFTFEHALSAIRFVCGSIEEAGTLQSITIKNLSSTGDATFDGNTFIWSNRDSQTKSYSQSFDIPIAAQNNSQDITDIEDSRTFMMIPQEIDGTTTIIELAFLKSGSSVPVKLAASIPAITWQAGYTYTYKIVIQDDWNYYIEGLEPVIVNYNGGNSTSSIKSYRKKKDNESIIEPVSWNLEYSTDGTNWSTSKPDWLNFSSSSGEGGTAGESITATINAQSGTQAGVKPVKEKHDLNLRTATPKGTSSNRFDLSYYNVATGQITATRSTANTYIVNASGYYKIPLVYGNAIKNDAANTEAYIAPATGTGTFTHYLRNFVNHADKPITDPWIKNGQNSNGGNIGTSGLNACIVWQDADRLISNVGIDGDYLTFDVANNTITQGNCMIAVRNSSNTIIWSWQIWVTDEDLSDTQKVTISGKQYDFMKVLLGWYSTGNAPVISYAGRLCYVRATNGHTTTDATVEQKPHEDVSISTKGSCTMYQWGRKDPFPGGDGEFNKIWRGLYQNTYNVEFCSPSRLEYVTIGKAIQRPYYMNFKFEYFWDWNDVCYTNFWNTPVQISDENLDIQGYDYNQYKSIQTVKTIYDPSPVGFTIPNGQAYDGIVQQESGTYRYDSSSRGFVYDSSSGSIFFPCCGYRNAAMLGMAGSENFWYCTEGFAIWSSTTAHLPTSFMLQYDPDDVNCSGYRLTTSNSNRPYLLGVALIAE